MYFVSTHFFWAFKKFTRADNSCMREFYILVHTCVGIIFTTLKSAKKTFSATNER